MKNIKIQQLDFRYLLVENYKEFDLNEQELAVLLLIFNSEMDEPSLITADQLILKMTLSEKEIDQILVNLISKKFLAYEKVGNIMVTSLKPMKEKILKWFRKEMFSSSEENQLVMEEDEDAIVYKSFETKLNRTLSSFELDAIHSWFTEGIKKEDILETLNEYYQKNGRVTIKEIDKMLLKKLTEKDREKEGYSAINEKNRTPIENTIKIVSSNWDKKNG